MKTTVPDAIATEAAKSEVLEVPGVVDDAGRLPDPFRCFPPHTRITVDVVFPGEYRIGWEYENRQAVPGTPRYFEFWEAAEYASRWFASSFPDAVRKDEPKC